MLRNRDLSRIDFFPGSSGPPDEKFIWVNWASRIDSGHPSQYNEL